MEDTVQSHSGDASRETNDDQWVKQQSVLAIINTISKEVASGPILRFLPVTIATLWPRKGWWPSIEGSLYASPLNIGDCSTRVLQ